MIDYNDYPGWVNAARLSLTATVKGDDRLADQAFAEGVQRYGRERMQTAYRQVAAGLFMTESA